jgi:hypothetical protein
VAFYGVIAGLSIPRRFIRRTRWFISTAAYLAVAGGAATLHAAGLAEVAPVVLAVEAVVFPAGLYLLLRRFGFPTKADRAAAAGHLRLTGGQKARLDALALRANVGPEIRSALKRVAEHAGWFDRIPPLAADACVARKVDELENHLASRGADADATVRLVRELADLATLRFDAPPGEGLPPSKGPIARIVERIRT